MEKFFGFTDIDDMKKEFEELDNSDFPTESEILIASYSTQMYEGDCKILYERDGKLFEVNGGHCSCYGLESQWSPEETTWEALAIRPRDSYTWGDHEKEAKDLYWSLIDSHTK